MAVPMLITRGMGKDALTLPQRGLLTRVQAGLPEPSPGKGARRRWFPGLVRPIRYVKPRAR